MSSGVNVIGFKEFQDKLKRLPDNLISKTGLYVKEAASDWAGRAARSAPVDQGTLNKIGFDEVNRTTWEVFSNAEYAPFVEWGTRSKKRVPAEFAAYANSIPYTKRQGAKEFIFNWCKRQGIDKKYWYVIYRSIMTKGTNPHPFFFIHKEPIRKILFAKLEALLNKEI